MSAREEYERTLTIRDARHWLEGQGYRPREEALDLILRGLERSPMRRRLEGGHPPAWQLLARTYVERPDLRELPAPPREGQA